MIFKRSNGEFRETDRVTRFKLIKSGKNWLRAATSNFGLLKVIRGQVEETVVAEVREDAVSTKSRHLLKGILVAAAVLSATTVANTTFADEVGNEVVSSSTAMSAPSVSTEAASLTEEASKEVSAPQNETATETKPSVASSSQVVESAVASDDKAILEQNASEAALLNQIAEKYASNHQNEEQKAAIKEAVAKVQAELPTKEASTNSGENAPSYAEQRSRLNKSVDDMMATLKDAGFNGNTTVNGAPAIQHNWHQSQQALLVASILTQLFQMRMVQRLKMQLSINLVTLWIQMLIAILLVYGNSLKQITLLELKQTLITTLLLQ